MVHSSNDIISYKKEEDEEGMPYNIVAKLRFDGLSAQQAFDAAGKMFADRITKFEELVSRLPSWGKDVDTAIASYLESCRNVARASVYFR